jgi:hypothetical protein
MTEPVPASAAPKSRLPVLLAIGAAAVLALLLVNVLGGGDDGGDESAVTTTTIRTFVTTTTAVAPGAAPTETFEVFSTKNPFLPLRSTGAATGTTGGTGTSTGGTGTGGTATGGTGSTATTIRGGGGTTATTIRGGGGTTATTTRTGGSGSVEPRRSDRVALLDVFAENGRVVANVRVNDTVHKVTDGETFAGNYRVLSLSQADDCGRFMFGDDTFRLCRGEETLK